MKATYIGQDKSMGFRTGKTYNIETKVKRNMIFLMAEGGKYCPYSRVETLLENWEIKQDEQRKLDWVDF